MAGIVGVLGPIPFMGGLKRANTFHEISKSAKKAYVVHRILGGNDLVEDCGFDLIDLTLSMKWLYGYTMDPSAALIALEGLMNSSLPVPIIVDGVPLGRGALTLFVVESIASRMTKWKAGTLVALECSVKLREYGNPFSIAGPLGALANTAGQVVGRLI
jgi:hypothetical protein